jgi:hypothetical protein
MVDEIVIQIFGIAISIYGIVASIKDSATSKLKNELISFKQSYIKDVHKLKSRCDNMNKRQKVILYQNKDLQDRLEHDHRDIDEKLNDVRLDIARLNKK